MRRKCVLVFPECRSIQLGYRRGGGAEERGAGKMGNEYRVTQKSLITRL